MKLVRFGFAELLASLSVFLTVPGFAMFLKSQGYTNLAASVWAAIATGVVFSIVNFTGHSVVDHFFREKKAAHYFKKSVGIGTLFGVCIKIIAYITALNNGVNVLFAEILSGPVSASPRLLLYFIPAEDLKRIKKSTINIISSLF